VSLQVQCLAPASNKILSALPADEYARIEPDLKPIQLTQGDRLYRAGDACQCAWFLLDGLLLIHAVTKDGETMDVGMIGAEGTAGLLAALEGWRAPFTATVEISGDALQISAEALRAEFNRLGRLHDVLLKYTAFLYQQIAQSALCGRFHSAEQRLSRVLLAISNRIESHSLPLTHERLSWLIGGQRPRVTSILDLLETEKLLHLGRGRISILDRKRLETHVCSCYHVIEEAMTQYLAHL
jgi:CRP-like cAMP-binding protein